MILSVLSVFFSVLWVGYMIWTLILLRRKFPDYIQDFLSNPIQNFLILFFGWPYMFSLVAEMKEENLLVVTTDNEKQALTLNKQ